MTDSFKGSGNEVCPCPSAMKEGQGLVSSQHSQNVGGRG